MISNNEKAFQDFAIDYYSNIDDIETALVLAQVNKYCAHENRTNAIWDQISKLYISENSLSQSQVLEQLKHEYFGVTKNAFPKPIKLGLPQISFIHAYARGYSEKFFWLELALGKKGDFKPFKEIQSFYNADGKEEIQSIHSAYDKLDADQKSTLVNFPEQSRKKDISNEYLNPVLGSFCNVIYALGAKVDACIENNKNNICAIESISWNSKGFFSLFNLFNVTNLKKLDLLGENPSGCFPEKITKLQNLTYISVKGSQIAQKLREFPKVLFSLKKLTTINLTRNRIESIPEGITQLTKLKSLILISNNIKLLDKCIYNHPSLTSINLNSNPFDIKNIPTDKKANLKIVLHRLSQHTIEPLKSKKTTSKHQEELKLEENVEQPGKRKVELTQAPQQFQQQQPPLLNQHIVDLWQIKQKNDYQIQLQLQQIQLLQQQFNQQQQQINQLLQQQQLQQQQHQAFEGDGQAFKKQRQ